MFLSEWREYPSAPCLAGKKNLMTARVSILLKRRASLTCFRACFLRGRAKDLSAPLYYVCVCVYIYIYIYICVCVCVCVCVYIYIYIYIYKIHFKMPSKNIPGVKSRLRTRK